MDAAASWEARSSMVGIPLAGILGRVRRGMLAMDILGWVEWCVILAEIHPPKFTIVLSCCRLLIMYVVIEGTQTMHFLKGASVLR